VRVPGLEEHLAEPTYAESVRRYHANQEQEMRARWYDFHSAMAELHARLAAEHEEKAEKLLMNENRQQGGRA
jgi:hypothetical protein